MSQVVANEGDLAPGQLLGRYELLAQVARGGMGQVWAARLKGARGFHKLVAVKTLLPELGADARIQSMLLEEARIASLIQHQNVVQTTELGEHHGMLYLVMEWLDGESLSFVLKRAEEREAMPMPVAVNLVAQACRGLHAAHELTSDLGRHLGVVHRDVSPHNVLVTHAGVVKLVDFGIAKAMNQDDVSFTDNGEIKGKYSYMAPEQLTGEEVDRRADVFSIAITLYLATTGRHPFKRNTKVNIIRAVTSEEPATLPSNYDPSYPKALETVLMKALSKAPDDRYESCQALRLALEHAVPEAFVPRFEAQVRDYLARVMGDRAAARREALRRFQLAADERALTDMGSGQMPMTSQSGGSLKAILIDQPNRDLASLSAAGRASQAPTEHGLRPRKRLHPAFAVAALGLGALGFALVRSHLLPGAHSAAAPAPAVTLAEPAREVPPPPAPPATATAVAPNPTPTATAAPTPSSTLATPPSAGSSAPRATPRSPKKAKKATPSDLIAPEYAN